MNWFIIGSSNGLSPDRRQAITWTNADLLIIGPLGTNFSEIGIKIQKFSLMKMHLNVSIMKWWPFCPGANELREDFWFRSSRWRSWRGVKLWVCCRSSVTIWTTWMTCWPSWLSQVGSWGLHGTHLGSTAPRWASFWPHEPCYQGWYPGRTVSHCRIDWQEANWTKSLLNQGPCVFHY